MRPVLSSTQSSAGCRAGEPAACDEGLSRQCRMRLFRSLCSAAISPSPFRAFSDPTRRFVRAGSSVMIGLVRAAIICATMALGLVAAQAADKAFKRDDLANSAIKLEAQIKSEAGPVAKSRRERCGPTPTPPSSATISATGLQILGQIAATAPEDSGNWLRLARPSSRSARQLAASRPFCSSAPRPRPTSPISAPATRLTRRTRWRCSAGRCRSASCGGRRWMRCGCRSTCARSPMSAANTRRCATSTASGCWITPSIPTRPRRAPVSSSPRISPSAPISRRSWRWPAPTSRR